MSTLSTINASSSSVNLPSYSPSLPAPSYSYEPACGEQRLELTPRSSVLRPTSTFIKKVGKETVILNEQEENAQHPSYGRQGDINGTLCLDDADNILKIELTITAKLDSVISEGGARSVKLIDHYYELWSSETSQTVCPPQIPFSAILPTTFQDGAEKRPLPPSYVVGFPGVPALHVKSQYLIDIIITKKSRQRINLWSKTKRISIPFTYRPRTRPHRPILPSPYFFSSVKTSPEEWFQTVSCLKSRNSSVQVEPVFCHLFIPSARIYGFADTIPFHVQLTGRVSSLRQFFAPQLERIISTDSNVTVSSSKGRPDQAVLRATLLRQVSVETRGEKAWRNITLGEATLYPVPPSCSALPSDTWEEHLDWEGDLRVDDHHDTVGGFTAGKVQVKDFIVLTLVPTKAHSMPFVDLYLSVPIRLVTDSWDDTTGLDSRVF